MTLLTPSRSPSFPGFLTPQDKSTSLDVLLAVATQRCAEDATPLVDPAARREPPGLLQQLLWFMSCFSTVMGLWRDNAGHRWGSWGLCIAPRRT